MMKNCRIVIFLFVVLLVISASVLLYFYSNYSIGYRDVVDKYAKIYDIDKSLIFAIIKKESNFVECAESPKGAKGLMQLMDKTAIWIDALYVGTMQKSNINANNKVSKNVLDNNLSSKQTSFLSDNKMANNINNLNLFDTDINIRLGVKYLRYLSNKYGDDIILILSAYNAGEGNVDTWIRENNSNNPLKTNKLDIDDIPFAETKNYVRKVLKYQNTYEKLYNL